MRDDRLLNIGAFAVLSGLSIDALRHYDDIGLLPPAEVDPVTAYRRYAPEQLAAARRIRALRAVDLPIEEIRRSWTPMTNRPGPRCARIGCGSKTSTARSAAPWRHWTTTSRTESA